LKSLATQLNQQTVNRQKAMAGPATVRTRVVTTCGSLAPTASTRPVHTIRQTTNLVKMELRNFGGKCKTSVAQGDGRTGCSCLRGFKSESCELVDGSMGNVIAEEESECSTASEGIKIHFSLVAVTIVVLAGALCIR
jgi:hypothetical protein